MGRLLLIPASQLSAGSVDIRAERPTDCGGNPFFGKGAKELLRLVGRTFMERRTAHAVDRDQIHMAEHSPEPPSKFKGTLAAVVHPSNQGIFE
jgi:hypothetical protein